MAAPLFSKICMYLYCVFGLETLPSWVDGGRVVAPATWASIDLGERCAVYSWVQVLMTGIICSDWRSARVRLCKGENVTT